MREWSKNIISWGTRLETTQRREANKEHRTRARTHSCLCGPLLPRSLARFIPSTRHDSLRLTGGGS
jgi:hypothetical protein